MQRKQNIFESEYIIDGVNEGLTPARLLQPFCPSAGCETSSACEPVVDESVDPTPVTLSYNPEKIRKYLSLTEKTAREFPTIFAGAYTRIKMARALIDALWNKGHFRLEDLSLKALWRWNDWKMGNMAAFYDSVMQAADCLDALSLTLRSYKSQHTDGELDIEFQPVTGERPAQDEDLAEDSKAVRLGTRRSCPDRLAADLQSWIIFIPFDTADFHLGGSLLNQALGISGGGKAPELDDTAYFMDCYEVVREFVEDGILLSGSTVGDGGLIATLDRMTSDGVGALADVSNLLRAYPGCDLVHALFAEVPGVVIQIRDSDYDYIDAELLLQDVAYFPLGHPTSKTRKVEIRSDSGSQIQNILDSLISR